MCSPRLTGAVPAARARTAGAVLAGMVGVMALVGRAEAHQTSVKYVDVTVEGRGAQVRVTVAPGDVTEALGLAAEARPTPAEASTAEVARYVAGWLAVGPEGRAACANGPARARPDADARFVVVEWRVTCDAALGRSALDFTRFFAVDARHEAIVTVHEAGAPGDAVVVRSHDPILHTQAGEAPGLGAWVAAGIDHIWSGRDHVCFVLALLLVVMLVRVNGAWTTRAPMATVRHTGAIITAFTLAHSLSLIAASLGWVSLPGRLVESMIAFSILYTAIENLVKPDVRWRFGLTFGFGLGHGLGFASVLQVMLPPDHVIGPLLGFNLGVEVGQLAIVAIALPIAWLACRELGAERYRRRVMPALSIVIGLIAVKWLIERIFGLTLGSFWGL
jgi:HupE / UreJ protein